MACLQIGIQPIFLQNNQNPLNHINIDLSKVLIINKNVIQIYDDKNIEFLGQDLVNIALKP